MVLATTLVVVTPAHAQNPSDFGSARPVPGHPDFEITDDGYLIYQGDMGIAKCGSVRREDYTASVLHREVVEICEKVSFSSEKAQDAGTTESQPQLPETGGPSLVCVSLALLYAGAVLVRTIA